METDSHAFQADLGQNRGRSPELAAADGSRDLSEFLSLAMIAVQVMLVAFVLQYLDVVTPAFVRTVKLALAGFLVHHFLPFKLRLPFFVLLSVTGIFLVLGEPNNYDHFWSPALGIPRALAVLAIGSVFIGICHLPIGFWKRAALLAAAGGVAALFRAGVLPSGQLGLIWPVLAAFFMFRTVIYLYEISTLRDRPPLSFSLAYFFMLPNVCCLFFPVVDFNTFRKSHYSEPAITIYRRGIDWMVRGTVQMLLCRLVDQLLYVRAADVTDGTDLIRYLIPNMFLYLKFSGLFHFIIGILMLFGFNLPETNHRYFLASSFSDYWRRVNIYWKDFMINVFFYPAFFKLKKRGTMPALIFATLGVFALTWSLHLYQAWWLKGSAVVSRPDAIFWLIFGVLVLLNSVWEMKFKRKRRLPAGGFPTREAAGLVLRTAATFTCLCLLWSLWNTPGVAMWLGLWKYADLHTLLWGVAVIAGIMVATILLEIMPARLKTLPGDSNGGRLPVFPRWALARCALLVAACVIVHPAVRLRIDAPLFHHIRDALAAGESMSVARNEGYYEQLGMDEKDRQLWETYMRRKIREDYGGSKPVRPVKDFRFQEPLPLLDVLAYDTEFQTNSMGMRDREYDFAAPPCTIRMAMLGSSHVMGLGVEMEKTFQKITEARLNDEATRLSSGARFEILNFAFVGYSPLSQISLLKSRVSAFKPDVVIFVAHMNDFTWVPRDLARALRERIPIPWEFPRRILDTAHVTSRTNSTIAADHLEPFEADLTGWAYRKMVEEINAMGAQPICVFMPLPNQVPFDAGMAAKVDKVKQLAAEAGFDLIDLSDVFDNQDPRELVTYDLADWRSHTNAKAHAIVADALYDKLMSDTVANLSGRIKFTLATSPPGHMELKNR